jgi:hypothetical protein
MNLLRGPGKLCVGKPLVQNELEDIVLQVKAVLIAIFKGKNLASRLSLTRSVGASFYVTIIIIFVGLP